MFFDKFFPDYYAQSVYNLPADELKKRGVKALFFDIDNTLAPFDCVLPSDAIKELFAKLSAEGFRLYIISNNNEKRVRVFSEPLKTEYIYRGGKPSVKKFNAFLEKLGLKPSQAAIIGDQVFTDAFCAKRAGAVAVLCCPLCRRDQLVTAVKRPLESLVMRAYFKKYGVKPFKIPD